MPVAAPLQNRERSAARHGMPNAATGRFSSFAATAAKTRMAASWIM
jgi:hypothetical protein